MREKINFNLSWQFSKDCQEWESVTLPHTWNAADGQDGGNDYYRGRCWYRKSFQKPALGRTEQLWLEIPAAGMTADVYLNDHRLVHHEGGYSIFRAELTPWLQKENELVIAVDNSENDRVYPQKADFTFYGGLYRGAVLIQVPENHFVLDYYGAPGIRVTPRLFDDNRKAEVSVEVWVSGKADSVELTVDGMTAHVPVENGYACALFTIENVHLWDGVNDPYQYTASARLADGDEVYTLFGCRSFRIDPEEGFFLNGRSYPLRGVAKHQDRKDCGPAVTREQMEEDLALIREMGANTIRLAHYQHPQEFYELCDVAGMIVWAEIPYITKHMPDGRENTLSQMRELVVQNYNHPSIVCWGLSNEITAATPVDVDMLENHKLLNELCHKLDHTRLTTMADVFMLETDSPILDIPDLNSYNLYFGWYLGELEQNDSFFDDFHAKYPARCIGFSEYGADANPQFQTGCPERGDYTEAYQARYHEHLLEMIEKRPYLWATHVWNMFDFAADGRDEGGAHGINQKGLVTFDRKTKKDAFYLYKAHWSEEPFVHIFGSRYVERAEEVTEVVVYTNQPRVTLTVDGKNPQVQTGKYRFVFRVPISGEHTLEAACEDLRDTIRVRRVLEPRKEYQFVREGIVNWFDREEYRPDCYSIKDKMEDIMRHPAAGAKLQEMIGRARKKRGDVAQSASANENLQRMMGQMRLESLLRQISDTIPAEEAKEFNAFLQTIRKEGN